MCLAFASVPQGMECKDQHKNGWSKRPKRKCEGLNQEKDEVHEQEELHRSHESLAPSLHECACQFAGAGNKQLCGPEESMVGMSETFECLVKKMPEAVMAVAYALFAALTAIRSVEQGAAVNTLLDWLRR